MYSAIHLFSAFLTLQKYQQLEMKQVLTFLPSISFTGSVYGLPRKRSQQGQSCWAVSLSWAELSVETCQLSAMAEGPCAAPRGTGIIYLQEPVAAWLAGSFWQRRHEEKAVIKATKN